ncbi:MAG: endonuclease, partial [Spartobacteria bacterium]|nr:endonuclease [Spartobacteria bacterium]
MGMRFILYNIRYGTGGDCKMPWSGYFRNTHSNLQELIRFVQPLNPDIVGLIEVDAGSFRANRLNQAETIACALGHYHTYRSKYSKHPIFRLPLLNKQGNAFLTRNSIRNEKFHYFDRGTKRLVIELELDDICIFLVHLSLRFITRQHQLSDLYALVKDSHKPIIVAGDFNARWGDREIRLFLGATG